MAYRIRYQAWIDWVTPGMGLGIAQQPQGGPGMVPAGNAQTIGFFNSSGLVGSTEYPPTSTTFLSSDVTNLLNSMSSDLSTQMNAQLTRIQNFSSGGG